MTTLQLLTNTYLIFLFLILLGLLDEGAIIVLESLCKNNGILKHLYLNGNGLGVKTAKVIGEILSDIEINFNDKKLYNYIDEEEKEFNNRNEFVSNIISNDEIEKFFHEDDIAMEMLEKNYHSSLLDDKLNKNQNKVKCSLSSLIIGVNRFGNEGAYYISMGLSQNRTLKKLSLPSNRIGISGCKYLSKALYRQHKLKSLLNSDGVVHSTEGIDDDDDDEGAGSLSSLNLGFNKSTAALGELSNYIQDKGCYYLSLSLCFNKKLRELDLTQNGIYQSGIDCLIKILREKKNVKLVTLRTGSWGITRNDIAEEEKQSLLLRNLNLCSKEELKEVAEIHMPEHVRDIYSVYRVA